MEGLINQAMDLSLSGENYKHSRAELNLAAKKWITSELTYGEPKSSLCSTKGCESTFFPEKIPERFGVSLMGLDMFPTFCPDCMVVLGAYFKDPENFAYFVMS